MSPGFASAGETAAGGVYNLLRQMDQVETASPGDSSSSNPDEQSRKLACQLEASYRIVADAAHCDCGASKPKGAGSEPNDAGDCATSNDESSGGPGKAAAYKLGARPKLDKHDIQVAPGGQVDCSGYVSSGLCRAGTPFVPGKLCADLTTEDMIKAVESGNSCYEPIPAAKDSKPNLEGGEVVVYPHAGKGIGHTFVVTKVDSNDCHKFEIMQSGGTGVHASIVNGSCTKGDDQCKALEALEKVNCGAASNAKDNVKIVRYNENHPGNCKRDLTCKVQNESSCVGKCEETADSN